jgi:hypothetical protein
MKPMTVFIQNSAPAKSGRGWKNFLPRYIPFASEFMFLEKFSFVGGEMPGRPLAKF